MSEEFGSSVLVKKKLSCFLYGINKTFLSFGLAKFYFSVLQIVKFAMFDICMTNI